MSKRKIPKDSALRTRMQLIPTDHFCPCCGAQLGAEHQEETWIEVPTEDGWILAYRLVKKGRRQVVAEARVFPDDLGQEPSGKNKVELLRERESGVANLATRKQHRRSAGTWNGKASSVPANGIPGEVLKKLRLTDPRQVLPLVRQNLIDRYGRKKAQAILRDFFLGTSLTITLGGANPGRRKLSDLELAEFSGAYVALVDAGVTNVIVQLAEQLHMSRDGIRSRRRSAIRRGILTPGDSSTGRAGGQLTARGKRILRKAPGGDR